MDTKDIGMDIRVCVLCNYVYGTFHKKGLGKDNILQIQNGIANIDGKYSIKIYLSQDDFIMDISDWNLLRNEIDNNIESWDLITSSHTHLNSIEFDCQSTSFAERKYKVKFVRDSWDDDNSNLYVYMDNKRIYFGFDFLDWETLKSNIDNVFWDKEAKKQTQLLGWF